MWHLRLLTPEDLPLYRPVRLRGLREHPQAFGSSFDEEVNDGVPRIGVPPNVTVGGFAGDGLAGIGSFIVSSRAKQRHKGFIVGFYVVPELRGSGLAAALLDRLIAEARGAGLRGLTLSVTWGNEPARRLYRRAGFVTYGVEPAALAVDGRLLDEELMALAL